LTGNGLVRKLVGGWQAQWLFTAQSGPPLGFGNALLVQDINQVALPESRRTPQRWLNTEAFNRNSSQQLQYNYRTLSTRFSGIRADGINLWNLSLIKSTEITEDLKIQFRFESFNAFNQTNFGAPNTSPTSTAFGRITTQRTNPRVIQLGLKLLW
jgi:hypothetical protein